ncbi:MAG: MFS transporter [Chloroflexi bacterium]|nr:MFS transporter [Chloroflexota bacterium]
MMKPRQPQLNSSQTSSHSSSRGHLFYGWVVVASCLIFSLVLFGIRYSFGVFFKPLEVEFGWSRAMVSSVFAVYMVLGTLFAMVGGWALDRYGPKLVVIIMGTVTGTSLLLTSHVSYMWQLYLTYSFLLALGTGATYTVVMSTGSQWFFRKRATALAIIGTGAGLGTLIMVPVAAQLISTYDWRTSFLALAILAWALVIPVSLIIKKGPGEGGDMLYSSPMQSGVNNNTKSRSESRDFSLAEAVKTRSYWLIFSTWFAYSFCVHLVMTHVVPRVQDIGIPPVQAATILSVVGIMLIPSRVLVGVVSDRIGRKGPGIVCALLQAVALLWLIGCTNMWMFYLFAIVYGIGYGGIDPPIVAMVGDLFGVRRLGTIMGSLVVGWGLGAALGPYITGLVFDLSNNYSMAFLLGALLMIMSAVFIYWIEAPMGRP